MRLSISVRIFVGFLVVLLVFGGVIGYNLQSSFRLRQDMRLISETYHPLALILVELRTRRGNLLNTIESFLADDHKASASRGISKVHKNQILGFRKWRTQEIKKALTLIRRGRDKRTDSDVQQSFSIIESRLLAINRSFRANEPLFDLLFTVSEKREKQITRQKLLRLESKLDTRILQLINSLKQAVRTTAREIEAEEKQDRLNILILVGVAILVSVSVTYGAQRTLRPLKTLVAGTKRIGSGDYEHRVTIAANDELGLLGREYNKMAQAIEEREQRLIRSERLAAVGQMASHITHEVRNPLSSISLNTELLEEEIETTEGGDLEEARNLCIAISKEVDRLTEITEEYLRFARLPKPRLETEDINEILLNLISFFHTELLEKQVEIVEDLEQDLPPVDADENQLRQAFLNLIRNAGEAMKGKGGTITIWTRKKDRSIVTRISDTGVGITEENLKRMFEPFFSTKEAGTGLGLALTQQIIIEHSGTIGVESTLGEGTTFTVTLPLAEEGNT